MDMKKRLLYTLAALMLSTLQASAQQSTKYTYDNLNRLTQVEYANGTIVRYLYDELGNRTAKYVLDRAHVKKGDVNGDGEVGNADIVAVVNIMAGITKDESTVGRADVNGDGEVDIADIVTIINIMTGK